MGECVFCDIVAGRAPASIIYEDSDVVAFMTLRPIAPGECLVIPKVHVDHFTDLGDRLAARMMVVAQHLGRRVREVFKPKRVGFVVHGFGIPHAHLIVVPQHGPHDITSGRFARVEDGKVVFSHRDMPIADRTVLDEHARLLRVDELTSP
ncbi:MAG TPA: HIT family protein [Clostridiales bacterium]|nr:HIT family protein [Clostridiales bacterium]